MNQLVMDKLSVVTEKAALFILLMLCSVAPYVCYPKIWLFKNKAGIDFFVYYKSILLYVLASVALIVLIIKLYVKYMSDEKIRIKTTLFLFTLWIGVSTCLSYNKHASFWGKPYSNSGFLAYVSYFIIFMLIINAFNLKYLKYFIYAVLASSSLMVFLCLTETYGIQILGNLLNYKEITFSTTVHTTFGNSNIVGSYFSIMAPLALMMFLQADRNTGTVILLVCAVACFVGLIVSMSRVSMLSVLLSCTLCLILMKARKNLYKKLILVLVLVAAITFTIDSTKGFTIKKQISNAVLQTQQAYETLTIKKQISNTVLQTQQASETNIGALGSGRMYYYKHFIKVPFINLKHGLFGIGPDCLYRYGYVPFGNVNGQENFQFDHKAHSDLIEYAATMGIPALVFYICFIVSIFYPVFKQIHSVPPEFLAIFAASLGYLIQSFFNIPNVVLAGIFFAFTAIIELHNNVAKDALAE